MPVKKSVKKTVKKSKLVINKSRLATFILGTVSLVAFVAYSWKTSQAKIVLRNQSQTTINMMEVQVNGKTFEATEVLPGEEQMWEFRPSGDGSFSVSGRLGTGGKINAASLGYTTNADTREHHLVIKNNGKVAYSSPK
jgi:hypothetical protein